VPAALSRATLFLWVRETLDRYCVTLRVAYCKALPHTAIYESSETVSPYCMTSWANLLISFVDIVETVATAVCLTAQTPQFTVTDGGAVVLRRPD
jgi:hypothetical protein